MVSERLSFYGVIGLTSLVILFLAFSQRYSGYVEHRPQLVLSIFSANRGSSSLSHATSFEINEVVDRQRRAIDREMHSYEYPKGKYGINASSLDDLVLEKGGTPIRSVIVTSWRSGSTFLGDVLHAHPNSFYHFEPLLKLGVVRVREPPLSVRAFETVDAMLKCEYHKLATYLNFGKNNHPLVFRYNSDLWRECENHKGICWDPNFVSKFCRLFPFQMMKIVRLSLGVAQKLLEEESLAIRMILLIRDPRGVLQSRKHSTWCQSGPDCSDPSRVCNDMVSDFEVAVRLTKKYPRNFRVIRYEDLSSDPFTHTKSLYEFYGLDFHDNVKKFLKEHTKKKIGGAFSTFRNSKTTAFHWRNDLNFKEVNKIQNACADAMKLWGYVLAANATHQKEFNPITDYFIDL